MWVTTCRKRLGKNRGGCIQTADAIKRESPESAITNGRSSSSHCRPAQQRLVPRRNCLTRREVFINTPINHQFPSALLTRPHRASIPHPTAIPIAVRRPSTSSTAQSRSGAASPSPTAAKARLGRKTWRTLKKKTKHWNFYKIN